MKTLISNDWQDILAPVFASPTYAQLHNFLKAEYSSKTIYPDMYHIFQAFEWCSFANCKVVILGQDPYHEPGQAVGASFAVAPGVQLPPSLINIYKELQDDLGITPVQHGYLKAWAEQGVLLLNSVLTVRRGAAYSHRGQGWEEVTDAAIKALSARGGVVFILWGRAAQNKREFIDETKNAVIASAHPSPLSAYRGFFGSKPFSRTNAELQRMGEQPINWQLPTTVAPLN
ncbi:uracil-DNA glycosylase [Lacticaseibacillus zhaodongensis]|uniref:uracil-DNA glycosylase n=1 Tax=Lacticaseibacillus zhaodongensis TaxID=2668065 RepID=UPI0012D369E3|nr:uracil-DNA glycosylase [Lacticaseibacillus zhaodongensis]